MVKARKREVNAEKHAAVQRAAFLPGRRSWRSELSVKVVGTARSMKADQ